MLLLLLCHPAPTKQSEVLRILGQVLDGLECCSNMLLYLTQIPRPSNGLPGSTQIWTYPTPDPMLVPLATSPYSAATMFGTYCFLCPVLSSDPHVTYLLEVSAQVFAPTSHRGCPPYSSGNLLYVPQCLPHGSVDIFITYVLSEGMKIP